MRTLYTRHANALPEHARDAIASLFGRDALDSRVCDLMTRAEWYDVFDGSAPRHAVSCYYCSGDVPAYRADHEDTHPCDAIGHQYCDTDGTCYGCGTPAPVVLAPLYASGTLVGKFPARITGIISRGTRAYFVKFLHNGETRGAFGHELTSV